MYSNIKKNYYNRSNLSYIDIVGGFKLMVLCFLKDIIIVYMYIKFLSWYKKV